MVITSMKQTGSLLGRKENNYTKRKQGDKQKRKKKRNEKKRPNTEKFKNKFKNERMVENKCNRTKDAKNKRLE